LAGHLRVRRGHEYIPQVLDAWLDIFPLVVPSGSYVSRAWRLVADHQMSYWDAMLVAACVDAGVTRLYTEDVQGKPAIEGVEFINPFKKGA
jgi:predicted nucleic acid-binding protein